MGFIGSINSHPSSCPITKLLEPEYRGDREGDMSWEGVGGHASPHFPLIQQLCPTEMENMDVC